jgi:hypothetical protein
VREGALAQFDLQYLEIVSRVAAHQQAERALLKLPAGVPLAGEAAESWGMVLTATLPPDDK